MSVWKKRALKATEDTKFGALLRAALRIVPDQPPMFGRSASVTSDGFIIADYTDSHGQHHMGAFVGGASDLCRNIEGLSAHCRLTDTEHDELRAVFAGWVTQDYTYGAWLTVPKRVKEP